MLFECFNKAERHCPERPQLAFSGRCFRHRNPIRFFFLQTWLYFSSSRSSVFVLFFSKTMQTRVSFWKSALRARGYIHSLVGKSKFGNDPRPAIGPIRKPVFSVCVCVCARVTTRHPKLFIASPKSIFSFRFAISSITSSRAALI